ncbi:MAG: carboxypeptidase regulatory-like domain-containing protein [Gemmatimonadota bacterium]
MIALLTLGLSVALPALAQSGARIAGRVVQKTTKAGILGAEVKLAPDGRVLVSDSAGYFTFDGVAAGPVLLLVRRIGFAAESASFAVASNEDLDVLIEMRVVPQLLDTVAVTGRETPLVRAKLAGYYDRKRVGIGKFIDGSELESEAGPLVDAIVIRTPGSKRVRARFGAIGWIATTRDAGARPQGTANMDDVDRRLGADPKACYPDVWLDGIKLYSSNSGMRLFDVNSIPANAIAAIEFYVGAARIPVQYNSSNSNCGVLLLWLK